MLKQLLMLLVIFSCGCVPALADNCVDLVNKGDLNRALACYGNQKNSAEKFVNIGTIYTLQEQYESALEYYKMAYNLKPDNPAIKYAYGVGLINASKNNSVISFADKNSGKKLDYTLIGSVDKVKVYSKCAKVDSFGEIVNYNY